VGQGDEPRPLRSSGLAAAWIDVRAVRFGSPFCLAVITYLAIGVMIMLARQTKKMLKPEILEELLRKLGERFERNPARHEGLKWASVLAKLEGETAKLWSLAEMERTGGEPDVVGFDKRTREYIFFDCSPETPKGRRSLCYDRRAWESRKEHKPADDALSMAAEMGVQLLSETEYAELQKLGEFDLKTSSWLQTPAAVRDLGGALFGDRRFGRVFTYHNGAESYYAARGWRGSLRV
jgi:hypothetical protein